LRNGRRSCSSPSTARRASYTLVPAEAGIAVIAARDAKTVAACLERFLEAFPHTVHTILTDNGSDPRAKPEDRLLALKACVWFRRARLVIVSPDSLGTTVPAVRQTTSYRRILVTA